MDYEMVSDGGVERRAGAGTVRADGTERLCRALYGHAGRPRDYLGGAGAQMLHDAADQLAALRVVAKAASEVVNAINARTRLGLPVGPVIRRARDEVAAALGSLESGAAPANVGRGRRGETT